MKTKSYIIFLLITLSTISISQAINFKVTTRPPNGTLWTLKQGKNNLFYIVTSYAIYRSTNYGFSWDSIYATRDEGFRDLLITPIGTIIYCKVYSGVIRSTDNGVSWTTISNGEYLSFSSSSTKLFAGEYRGFYGCAMSTDDGVTWSNTGDGLPFNLVTHEYWRYVYSLCPVGNQVYAGTYTGVYRLTADKWEPTNWQNETIQCLNKLSDETIIGIGNTSKKFGRSVDHGISWDYYNISTNVILSNNNLIVNSQDHIFFGNELGSLYRSTNKGSTWELIKSFPHPIQSLLIDSEDTLRVCTSNAIYKSIDKTTSVIHQETKTTIPEKYYLEQNYPNPFNPITNIEYYLPQESAVKIMVYDVLGKEIKTLVDEKKSAGNYQVQFDGSKLSSGMYFYKLQSNDFVQTKKLILLK